MATRARRDRLEVHRDAHPEVVPEPAASPSPAPAPDSDWVEPELYGVRTSWQSEAVRIEAAEFLVATRVQEASRRRLARLTARMRDQRDSEDR